MTISLADFRALHPEFDQTADAFVQAHLDEQAHYLDTTVLGNHADEVHRLRAAHAMALSPHGQAAKLVSKMGETTYGQRLREIEIILGHGYNSL